MYNIPQKNYIAVQGKTVQTLIHKIKEIKDNQVKDIMAQRRYIKTREEGSD